MRCVIFFLLVIFHFSLTAQTEIISRATEFIVAKKYDEANLFLDSILKEQKKNVDALMMKGNVILNKHLSEIPDLTLETFLDESVLTGENGTLGESVKIPDSATVKSVATLWKQCLKIDSSRVDILKGLCTLYAMALMKDELEKIIPVLIKTEKDDGEQVYRIAEYARKFKERKHFNETMEVYQFIAKQFPNNAGIRCDIASEYFYAGKLNEALAWLDSTYNFKTVDETSFLNGAFIYSDLGYYDDAQNVLNSYSHIYQRKMDKFYFGLRLFADADAKYPVVLSEFCSEVDSNQYAAEVFLARLLLLYKDTFTLDDYKFLADDKEIPEYYKALIHYRGMKQFTNNCEPFLIYGVFQNSLKNFSAAVQFLADGEQCKMKPEQTEYWLLNYGYALYMSNEKGKSLPYFAPLFQSKDSFKQQAAKYFTAQVFKEQKRHDEATQLVNEIVSSPEKTKYRTLAEMMLRN